MNVLWDEIKSALRTGGVFILIIVSFLSLGYNNKQTPKPKSAQEIQLDKQYDLWLECAVDCEEKQEAKYAYCNSNAYTGDYMECLEDSMLVWVQCDAQCEKLYPTVKKDK